MKHQLYGGAGQTRQVQQSFARSAMFIGRTLPSESKLRRNSMFRRRTERGRVCVGPFPCRSYGAWQNEVEARGYNHGAPDGASFLTRIAFWIRRMLPFSWTISGTTAFLTTASLGLLCGCQRSTAEA